MEVRFVIHLFDCGTPNMFWKQIEIPQLPPQIDGYYFRLGHGNSLYSWPLGTIDWDEKLGLWVIHTPEWSCNRDGVRQARENLIADQFWSKQ